MSWASLVAVQVVIAQRPSSEQSAGGVGHLSSAPFSAAQDTVPTAYHGEMEPSPSLSPASGFSDFRSMDGSSALGQGQPQ